jgi:hypothetical protein
MMEVDDKTALMTKKELEALPEYSSSIPTGTTIGKRWKRQTYKKSDPPIPVDVYGYDKDGFFKMVPDWWLMGEYATADDPKYVKIIWRNVICV